MIHNLAEELDLDSLELIAGSLYTGDAKLALSYWPLELGRLRMTIVTDCDQGFDQKFLLKGRYQRIMLRVHKTQLNIKNSKMHVVTLVSTEEDCDIEAFMQQAPELRQQKSSDKESASDNPRIIVAARFSTEQQMSILARTFGTRGDFKMVTENVSKSGLLIREQNSEHVPFSLNTIIELTLDQDAEQLDRPISCLGKVERLDNSDPSRAKFGVRIIDIDEAELQRWHRYIETVERETFAPKKGKKSA